jgi:chaperone modulatory protein CbpM
MISVEVLLNQLPDLPLPDLERWISNDWVRPDGRDGDYAFREIDVARVRLIQELRDTLEINEAALPVVLLLLDQLYDLRRRMRELRSDL